MLNAIRIGNFKAFADTQRIPIRPLTLIYGANSSGKSSILHSLLFARHVLETGDLDVFETEISGESVDLGGFRQFIYHHELDKKMVTKKEDPPYYLINLTTFTLYTMLRNHFIL